MNKFKAFCPQLNETFHKESNLDLKAAVAVKYVDNKGEKRITVGWSTSTYVAAVHSILSQINVSSADDERIELLFACNVEKIS